MLDHKQSVDINNLSCENVETNNLNFDHVVDKNPAKIRRYPLLGLL